GPIWVSRPGSDRACVPEGRSRWSPCRISVSVVGRCGADLAECGLGVALLGEVAEAHESDQLAVVDDGQAADGPLTHDLHRLCDGVVRTEGHEVVAAYLLHRSGSGVGTVGDRAHDDVAVGDDATQVAVL